MISIGIDDYVKLLANSIFCGAFLSVFRVLCHLVSKAFNSFFAKIKYLKKLKKMPAIFLSLLDFAFVLIASLLYMAVCFISTDGLFSLYGVISLIISYILMSALIGKTEKYLYKKIKKQHKNK